jgi:hypothetical protein
MKLSAWCFMFWAVLCSVPLSANTLILHFCCGGLQSMSWVNTYDTCCSDEASSDCCKTTVIHLGVQQTAVYSPTLILNPELPTYYIEPLHPMSLKEVYDVNMSCAVTLENSYLKPPDSVHLRVLKI